MFAKLFKKKAPKEVKCSFCGKTRDQVKKIITGPSVYICNECVDLCNEVLREADQPSKA